MNITIVTCWLSHPELAEDYVAAVEPELEASDDVFIIDNGDAPALPFETLTPGLNLGFAEGSNFGLRQATTEAVLFLNNDIAPKREGWLQEIRSLLEPGVLVGPLRFDPHADVGAERLPYIDGWCLAGMREDLLELGGFDATLDEPAYYSDNLLSLSAREAGMTLRNIRVRLHHKLNVTAGTASDPDVLRASSVNRARYIARVREALLAA